MRISSVLLALLVAACSTTETENDGPVARCESTSCFDQNQIRDFEVVDDTTLVVYVGPRQCPFRVDLSGTFCDVTFLPGGFAFRPTDQRAARQPDTRTGQPPFGGGVDVLNARVCANDFSLGIDEGSFSEAGGGVEDPSGLDCRVRDVASLTDDELLELYVEKRIVPPPPPIGAGRIDVEESEEPEETSETPAEQTTRGSNRE